MTTEAGILTATSSNASTGLNFSLVKLGPMVQVILGATFASMALTATTLTVIVVATTSSFSPPSLKPDEYITTKSNTLKMDVLINDADPKGGALAISKVTQPLFGTVEIDPGNFLTYTPQNMGKAGQHFKGTVEFTYSVKNSKLEATTNVTVVVTNHAPEPVNLVYNVPMNTKNNVANVFSDADLSGKKAQDIDFDDMTVVAITQQPANGVLTISADKKTISYTPNTGFTNAETGIDIKTTTKPADVGTFSVTDGDDTKTATLSYYVTNEPPVANPDSFVDQPKNVILKGLDLLANDVDANGDDLTITSVNSQVGYVEISADKKTVDYYPVPGVANDVFEYSISDGVLSSQSFVSIGIKNQAPTAGTLNVDIVKNSKDNVLAITYDDADPFTTLTVSVSQAPAQGSFSLSSQSQQVTSQYLTGFDKDITYTKNTYTLTYTPATGKLYTDVLQYTVSDGEKSTVGIVNINVINTAPVAVADTASTEKNVKKTINLIANDNDPNGDALKIKSVTQPTDGSVTVLSDSSVEFTPGANSIQTATFTYTVMDIQDDPSKSLTSTASVTVSISNTAPVAADDSFEVQRGSTTAFDVLANDSDANGDALTITLSSAQSAAGVPISVVGGKVQYTALTGAPYTDTFKYKANDGSLDSNEATATIVVKNTAPVAVDDNFSLKWNTQKTLDVLANDSDLNGDDLSIVFTSNPTSGTITVNSKKTITYTPTASFVGTDSFTYKVSDGIDESNVATVTLSVTNTAPVAVDDTYTGHHFNTAKVYDVLANDSDADGDAITIKSITQPTNGVVVVEGSKLKFTATSVVGVQTFQYTITDGHSDATATVSVTVSNTAPVANADSAFVHWKNAAGVQINVLDNDVDADLDALSVVSFVAPTKGSVSQAGNVLTYIPDGSSKGDVTFQYTITDGSAQASATVTVTVTNKNVPSTSDESHTIHWRTTPTISAVTTSGTDGDGDSLDVTASSPAHGVATKSTDGSGGVSFSYAQSAAYKGLDSYQVTISDGLDSAVKTVSFTITNAAPVAKSYSVYLHPANFAAGLTFNVAADGSDSDSADASQLTVKSITAAPTKGSAVLQNGNTQIKYTPTDGQVGIDTIKYKLTDGLDESTEATISIDLLEATLSFKTYTTHWKQSSSTGKVYFVTENIKDQIDSKTLHLTSITSNPTSGTVTFEAAEVLDDTSARVYRVNYKSNTGFVGSDTFKLEMKNSDGSVTTELTVQVTVTNAIPTANDISTTLHWATASKELAILTGSADADTEDTVVYDSHVNPTCGTVTESAGKLTFTNKSPAVLGACSFNFVVTDGLAKVTKTATVNVQNNAPVASAQTFNIHWTQHKAGFAMNLVAGATDADGDSITLSSVSALSDTSAGTLSKTSTSATLLANTPSSFVNKAVSFSYTLTDGIQTVTKLVTVNVNNNAPVAVDDTLSITGKAPQVPVEIDVLANDKDADQPTYDATLSIKSFSYSGTGSVSKSGNKLSYTPAAGFVGSESISYVATDGMSDSNTATVSITVSNSAPNAVADFAATHWKNSVAITPLTNDNDAENNTPLSLDSITQNPTSGTVSVSGSTVTYTPKAALTYTGTDGAKKTVVETFKYKVKDTYGLSAIGTVSVTVSNTPPVAVDQTLSFSKTTANPTKTIDVVAAASDADGDSLSIQSISYTSGNGAAVSISAGKIDYKPASSFRGVDVVNFVITDGQLTASGQITITVTNEAPTCTGFSKTIDKRTAYTYNLLTEGSASDPNGDALTVQLDASNDYSKAEVVVLSSSSVKVTSKARRSGTFTFKYRVSDGLLTSAYQTVTITINNKAPVAVTDTFGAIRVYDASHTIDVLANDSDPDADDSLSLVSVTIANNAAGTVSISGNKVIFNPANDFKSTTTATYVVKDNDQDNSKQSSGTINLSISNVSPTVGDDSFKVDMNTPAVISIASLLENDVAPAGMSLVFDSLVACNTLDNSVYCVDGLEPALNSPSSGYITVSYKQNSCRENKFKYCVHADKLPNDKVCGTVSVKYQNCVCSGKVDVVFALDSSGSMSWDDWRTQVDFSRNISIAISADAAKSGDIRVGLVQYGSYSSEIFGLSTYGNSIKNKFDDLKNNHQRGWTGTLDGLNKAIGMHDGTGTRKAIPKVLVVLTDGVANRPCSCSSKCDYYGSSPCSQCKSCNWDPPNHMCQPCASPVPRAVQVNSWKKSSGSSADWKVVAMGLGNDMNNYNSLGWNIIKGMNYDPSQTLLVKFENLAKATQSIVDEICSVSY
eukprot:gene8887-837_t